MKLTSFGATLLLGISFPSAIAAIERVVLPGQSIAAKIQDAHASGDHKPQFTLNAERAESNRTNYMVRVREAVPAVTSMTTISTQNGTSRFVNEVDVATMLVSNEDGVFALISVDKKGGKVDGIVQKNGENMKFTQRGGGGKVRFEYEMIHFPVISFRFAMLTFHVALPFHLYYARTGVSRHRREI